MSENKKKKFNPFPIIFIIGGGLLGFWGMDIFDKLFGNVVTENPLIIPFIMLMFLLSFFLAPLAFRLGGLTVCRTVIAKHRKGKQLLYNAEIISLIFDFLD